jgi:hypothetical protein
LPAGLGLLLVVLAVRPTRAAGQCLGDCDGSGAVSVGELVIGVNIALGLAALASCPDFDSNHDGMVGIDELLGAVGNALTGCPVADPTTTPPLLTPTAPPPPTPTPSPEEFVAAASDFECLTDWTHIRHFRITNELGHLDDTLAVAHGTMPLPYPVGTIIQLVPTEAMVKRGGGFFPAGDDWGFFVLSPSSSGTEITKRGRDEVVNVGPPCFACHSAAVQKDLICETTNGCVALNLSEALINALQNGDPRCTASATERH